MRPRLDDFGIALSIERTENNGQWIESRRPVYYRLRRSSTHQVARRRLPASVRSSRSNEAARCEPPWHQSLQKPRAAGGDVIRMGPQPVRDETIHVRQRKTGATLTIPVHIDLRAVLDATPAEHLTFLVTRLGRPFEPAARSRIDSKRNAPPRRGCRSAHRCTDYARPAVRRRSSRPSAAMRAAGGRALHKSRRSGPHGAAGDRGHSRTKPGEPSKRFANSGELTP